MLTIDPSTGAIAWDSGQIHPTMTEDDLLQMESVAVKLGGAQLANDVTYTHYTVPRVLVEGGAAAMAVYFENRGLTVVTLRFRVAGDTDWSDWSADREWRRQRVHHAFLERLLGAPETVQSLATSTLEERPFTERRYAFPWAAIGSTYDSKSGVAEIYIRYT
jgi:hypothetical protein